MTYQSFKELVWRMREAQKEYFRFRGESFLKEAKRLERLVDQELKDDGQGNLF